MSTCIILKGDTPLRSFDTSISYFYGLDVTVAFGLPLLLFELPVPSPVSLVSTDLRSRNKLAASLILLNSIQKALTSIAISLILMLLLRMSDCKNTQTYNKNMFTLNFNYFFQIFTQIFQVLLLSQTDKELFRFKSIKT